MRIRSVEEKGSVIRLFSIAILLLLVALTFGACRERETVPDLTGTTTVHRDEEPAYADTAVTTRPVERDQFVSEAVSRGLAEVELGQIAREQGRSADVRQFGERMVRYHGENNEKILRILRDQEIEVPAEMTEEQRIHVRRLGRLEGAEFDRQYIQQTVENHHRSTELYRRASESDINPELRQFATETLPDLEDHFERALAIQAEVRGARSEPERERE